MYRAMESVVHDCILRQVHQLEGVPFHSLPSISIIAALPPTSLISNRFNYHLASNIIPSSRSMLHLKGHVVIIDFAIFFLSTFILRPQLPVSSFSFSHI